MCRTLCALTFASMVLLEAPSVLAAPPVYYSIELDGKPIGFATVTLTEVELEGQKLLSVNARTKLKIGVLGAERIMVRRSQTFVDLVTRLPVSFRVDTDTNGQIGHIESEFKDGKVSTWAYPEGQQKGEPVVTELADDTCILGSNNFGHWGIVLGRAIDKAKDGAAVVSVYLPDVKQVAQFPLKKVGPETIQVQGRPRACDKWTLEGGGVSVFADCDTKQLVLMDLAAQKTTIKLADENVVQALENAGVQEMLAQSFVQSNVTFDDMMKVTVAKAEIDVAVIGSGPGNDEGVLTTAMQQFEGQKREARIEGTVIVRSVAYKGEHSPAFPTQDEVADALAEWVQPSAMIESDDPEIVALAKQLTDGASTRWEAVQRVATWVKDEIKYAIADTPSAHLALEKRKGDCGPHSTLMVAMLRSLKIPAKLVGGVIYTPSFGGTFGQHAWVEVHMGEDGWVSLDPTTGENEQINATHIKLFEGMGGVVPNTINVVAYEPQNRALSSDDPTGPARPLSWKRGQEYVYKYTKSGQDIGNEKFRFEKIEVEGREAIQLHDTLDLADGAVVVKSTSLVTANPDATPISFHREMEAVGKKYVFDCEFQDNVVKTKITGAANLTRDIKIAPGVQCFDNNLIGTFTLICSQLALEPGKTIDIRTYHPSSMQILALSLKVGETEQLKVQGKDVECYKCLVEPIKNTLLDHSRRTTGQSRPRPARHRTGRVANRQVPPPVDAASCRRARARGPRAPAMRSWIRTSTRPAGDLAAENQLHCGRMPPSRGPAGTTAPPYALPRTSPGRMRGLPANGRRRSACGCVPFPWEQPGREKPMT